jgi:hypothetical protein
MMAKSNSKKINKKNTSRDYELFTKDFFERRLKQQMNYDVPVLHQATLKGKDVEPYIIDLHYELEIVGGQILTLIECKYWNYKVQRRNVNDFRTVICDVGAHKGIIVTKIGFDKGAIRVAKKNKIGLFKLTEEEFFIHSSWTETQDNLNKTYELLQSEQSATELKGTFSGLFFSDDTSLWHFLMIKYGANFGKYLLEFCFKQPDNIDNHNFEMPDGIRAILISINVFNLHKEYILYETAGLNLPLANEEFVKGTFNAIKILQFKAMELNARV